MSLKAFHIFFVATAVLLALGFGAWALWQARASGGAGLYVLGGCSLAVGAALIVYGRKVFHSLRRL